MLATAANPHSQQQHPLTPAFSIPASIPAASHFTLTAIHTAPHARSTTINGHLHLLPPAYLMVDRVCITAHILTTSTTSLTTTSNILRHTLYTRQGGHMMTPKLYDWDWEFVLNGVGTEGLLPVNVRLVATVERTGKKGETDWTTETVVRVQ